MDGGLFDSAKQVLVRWLCCGQVRNALAIPPRFAASPQAKVLYALAHERSLGEAELVLLTGLSRAEVKQTLDRLIGHNVIRRTLVASTTAPSVDTTPAYSLADAVLKQCGGSR